MELVIYKFGNHTLKSGCTNGIRKSFDFYMQPKPGTSSPEQDSGLDSPKMIPVLDVSIRR